MLATVLMAVTLVNPLLGQIVIESTDDLGQSTWDQTDDVYLIRSGQWNGVTVRDIDTLRITEGVCVEFEAGAGLWVTEGAVLLVQGGPTEGSRVKFSGQNHDLWEGVRFYGQNQAVVSRIHFGWISDASMGIRSGGVGQGDAGASFEVYNSIVENCRGTAIQIEDNTHQARHVKIINNLLRDNGDYGIQIAFNLESTIEIKSNLIFSPGDANEFGIDVSGFVLDLSIHNNIVHNFRAGIRTAGAVGQPTPSIINNVITACGQGIVLPALPIRGQVRYNDAFNNPFGDYVANGISIPPPNQNEPNVGNISADPQFVNEWGDYHLLGGSPCTNSGDPNLTDFHNNTRSDMGTYGGPENVTKVYAVARPGVETHWWGTLPVNPHPDIYTNYYYIYHNIVVPPSAGVDLTVAEGNTFRTAAGKSIRLDGRALQAIGTQARPIIFEGIAGALWWGIQLDGPNGPTSQITHCQFTHASYGVTAWTGYATISQCSFVNCQVGAQVGITSQNRTSSISNCSFTGSTVDGIWVFSAKANITDCQVSNGAEGIWINKPTGTSNLTRCNVFSNNTNGVKVDLSNLQGPAVAVLNDCDIHDNNYGLYVSSAVVTSIANEYYANRLDGVYLLNSMGYFGFDRIYGNDLILNTEAGMYCFNSDPIIQFSRITDNYGYGITCAGGSDPVLSTNDPACPNRIRNNGLTAPFIRLAREEIWMDALSMVELNLGHNDIYDDMNGFGTVFISRTVMPLMPIMASLNYWGQPGGPVAGNFNPVGLVMFNPFDVAPNVINSAEEWASADSIFAVGVQAMTDSSWDEASDIFREIVADYPESRAAIYSLTKLRYCLIQSNGINEEHYEFLSGLSRRVRNQDFVTQLERNQSIVLQDIDRFDEAERRIRRSMEEAGCRADSIIYAIDLESALLRHDNRDGNHVRSSDGHDDSRLQRLGQMIQGKTWEQTDPNYVPESVALLSAYPNPFNSSVNIAFNLGVSGVVKVGIYDLAGREVGVLASGYLTEGQHTYRWQAQNLPTGVYIARVKTESAVSDLKMILIK